MIILEMLVDDGMPSRQDRMNLFSSKFTQVAISNGPNAIS